MQKFRRGDWQNAKSWGSSLLFALSVAALVLSARPAYAVPSFARQTGLACSSCHTVFPELTSFGRAFKLHGYTAQGLATIEEKGTDKVPPLKINQTFPLSLMFQTSVTRTDAKQPGTQNGNVEFPQELSLFLAGEITPHLGTFIQATYDGQDDHIALDNTDVRYSNDTEIGGKELVYGLTVNNNPTVEDLWHTTPTWAWPFANADSAPTPAAGALIEDALGQEVAGLGAYGMWNKHLYAVTTVYRSAHIGSTQPPSTTDNDNIQDVAPYWRLAWQQNFGVNYLEVGTYGMYTQLNPGGIPGGTNDYTDVACDTQFERPLGADWLSAHATYIYENQNLHASHAADEAANGTDHLHTFRLDGIYHVRSRFSAALGYFLVMGNSDSGLYQPEEVDGSANGSPDSQGMTLELNYFPWQNVRLSALYTTYFEFNGRTNNYDGFNRSSFDNGTLYFLAWLVF